MSDRAQLNEWRNQLRLGALAAANRKERPSIWATPTDGRAEPLHCGHCTRHLGYALPMELNGAPAPPKIMAFEGFKCDDCAERWRRDDAVAHRIFMDFQWHREQEVLKEISAEGDARRRSAKRKEAK